MTLARRLLWLSLILIVTLAGIACTCTNGARCTVLGSGGGEIVVGSGRETEEVRPLAGPIVAVDIDMLGDVEILDDAASTITIHAEENILPCLETVVVDQVLHIRTRTSFRSDHGPRFTVRIPAIATLRRSGCGSTTALALRGAAVAVDASGVGSLVLGGEATSVELESGGTTSVDARQLRAATWRIRQGGVGEVQLAGRAERADLGISGSGSIQGRDWAVGSVVVHASGVGGIDLGRIDELDATISGIGSLTYSGQPVIKRQSISGLGGIRSR